MIDTGKVIDGLGRCASVPDRGYNACEECPYNNTPMDNGYASCRSALMRDAKTAIAKTASSSNELRRFKRFKEYFDDLYGEGLEVANWHLNGDTEPFDNFYDSAVEHMESEEVD